MPAGRPPKLTDEEKAEVVSALAEYIDAEEDPTIVGFVSVNPIAIQYDVSDDNINDWEQFTRLRKRAVRKQEHYLLKQGGAGKYNPTIAIFRLKQPQHGYTDRQDRDITSGGNAIAPVLVRFINDETHDANDPDSPGV